MAPKKRRTGKDIDRSFEAMAKRKGISVAKAMCLAIGLLRYIDAEQRKGNRLVITNKKGKIKEEIRV